MRHRGSFSETRERRKKLVSFVVIVLSFLLIYEAVSIIGFRTYSVAGVGMMPTIRPGDRVGLYTGLYRAALFAAADRKDAGSFRGDMVLVNPPGASDTPWYRSLFDELLRFSTFQFLGLSQPAYRRPGVKRVIGVPGDAIYMKDRVFFVRPRGETHFLTEFEVSNKLYNLVQLGSPAEWSTDMPLSDYFAPVALGPDEFFVVDDDRTKTGDSRFFGPVKAANILGKVVFRYWPLRAMTGF